MAAILDQLVSEENDALNAAAEEPQYVELTPRQAIQHMADIRKNFELAVVNNDPAQILTHYNEAKEWEASVLKPNRLDQRLSASAEAHAATGNTKRADYLNSLSVSGFNQIARAGGVNMFELRDKNTANGIRANHQWVSQTDAKALEDYRLGKVDDADPRKARLTVFSNVLNTKGDDETAVQSAMYNFDKCYDVAEATLPKDSEGKPLFDRRAVGIIAMKLSKATEDSGIAPSQLSGLIGTLKDSFAKVTLPAADGSLVGGQKVSIRDAYDQSVEAVIRLAEKRPEQVANVIKLLNGDYGIKGASLRLGTSADGVANNLGSLAERLNRYESTVSYLVPGDTVQDKLARKVAVKALIQLSGEVSDLVEQDPAAVENAKRISDALARGDQTMKAEILASGELSSATQVSAAIKVVDATVGGSKAYIDPVIKTLVETKQLPETTALAFPDAAANVSFVENPAYEGDKAALLALSGDNPVPVFNNIANSKVSDFNQFGSGNQAAASTAIKQAVALSTGSIDSGATDSSMFDTKLAASLGVSLNKDASGNLVFANKDDKIKFDVANAKFKSSFSGNNTSRDLEELRMDFGGAGEAVKAMFTDVNMDDAKLKKLYDSSFSVNGVTFKVSDLYDSPEEANEVIGGGSLSRKDTLSKREAIFKRAVTRGVYKWDPTTNFLVRDPTVKIESVRPMQNFSKKSTIATIKLSDGAGGTFDVPLDMTDPANRNVAQEALVWAPKPGETGEAAKQAWARVQKSAYDYANHFAKYNRDLETVNMVHRAVAATPAGKQIVRSASEVAAQSPEPRGQLYTRRAVVSAVNMPSDAASETISAAQELDAKLAMQARDQEFKAAESTKKYEYGMDNLAARLGNKERITDMQIGSRERINAAKIVASQTEGILDRESAKELLTLRLNAAAEQGDKNRAARAGEQANANMLAYVKTLTEYANKLSTVMGAPISLDEADAVLTGIYSKQAGPVPEASTESPVSAETVPSAAAPAQPETPSKPVSTSRGLRYLFEQATSG